MPVGTPNRDPKKHKPVYKELIKYGFVRNFYGIKFLSLSIYFLSILWEIYRIKNFSLSILLSKPYPEYLGFCMFLITFIIILLYSKKNVESNAEAYAKALLDTCEESK